jgi:hypothetical protein
LIEWFGLEPLLIGVLIDKWWILAQGVAAAALQQLA